MKISDQQLKQLIEASIFVADSPLSVDHLQRPCSAIWMSRKAYQDGVRRVDAIIRHAGFS